MKAFIPRRGSMLVYVFVILVALMAMTSLAVDFGRAQLAKTELQQAADAAARYGAAGLSQGVNTVRTRVSTVAAENKVDGQALLIDLNQDLEFGVWDKGTGSFQVLTGGARAGAMAIRVTARKMASRNTAVPTLFSAPLGRSSVDMKAVAIAARGTVMQASIPADSSPWLAGMPNGSRVTKYDGNSQDSVAPAQTPPQILGLDLTPGTMMSFRQTGGTTSWDDGSEGTFGPDGDTSWIVEQRSSNGINSTEAPINSLVGIFLDDRRPNTWNAATPGDFSTNALRNFTTYAPPLKQVFFIGDGMNSSGQLQQFQVPNGATRFYLGIMDEKGWWWDNHGTLTTSMMDDNVTLVK